MEKETFTLLHRINPHQNERRFYAVMIGPTLDEPLAVIRFWGRIGGWQRVHIRPFDTPEEAEKFAGRLVALRLKRGYKKIQIKEQKKESKRK